MSVFLTNDGVSIHYEVNGSGRPLVMLHGWDQSARAFCRNVPALSEKYQVVTVDFRGHGESEKPSPRLPDLPAGQGCPPSCWSIWT